MCRSFHSIVKGLGVLAVVAVIGFGLATPANARLRAITATEKLLFANTCNGNSELSYPTAPNFASIGDTIRVTLSLGAGGIDGGTTLSISRVRFNLDCNNSNLGINCADDGGVISYQANLSTTCASAFVADHVAGDTLPNQVVFTPTTAIAIPANTPSFCTLSFDVRIETTSNDGTPNVIEEVSGFDASLGDGVCNTAPPLAAGNTNSGSITLCPVCDDGNQCNGPEICDPQFGCQPGAPFVCNDNDPCTSDVCNPAIPAPTNPCVFTPGALNCNDNDPCTSDACVPGTGCVNTPGALNCNDNDPCTTDACVPGTGCVNTPGALNCNDNDPCTNDACVPGTGCVNTPGALNCNDNDPCTDDACVPGTGCVNTPGGKNCNDNDPCTNDACVPGTGCVNTPGALDCDDHDKCTNDACVPGTGCVNTPGGLDCDDHDQCTTDRCDPVEGCINTPGALNCDDNDPCTDDRCDPVEGCVNTDNGQCNLICRTPGFWGTHADADPSKPCSQDITGAVLAMVGGSISVCGECISNGNTGESLSPNDAASAIEAMCVRVQGQSERQLARQLTAAALNCIISSGSSATCANTSVIDWATCNAVCQGTSTAKTVGECIDEIDAFNNGVGTGCHDRELPLDTIFPGGTRCAGQQGPAGSDDECSRATDSACTVIQPNETRCASDSCP
jgi:hypothetical protein